MIISTVGGSIASILIELLCCSAIVTRTDTLYRNEVDGTEQRIRDTLAGCQACQLGMVSHAKGVRQQLA